MSNNNHGVHLVRLTDVSKSYVTPAGRFLALEGISLTLPAGSMTAVVGKSGSGKSTLLNLVAGIDRPDVGAIQVGETAIEGLGEDALSRWRGRQVGVVFQFFQLLPTLTVLENVLLPMDLCGTLRGAEAEERARALLALVGIAEQADKLPATLSGGQQQRAAIARALANDPPLLLADEPTGNLDSRTAQEVLGLLKELTRAGKTVVLVTHERDIAPWVDAVVTLRDGRGASSGGAS